MSACADVSTPEGYQRFLTVMSMVLERFGPQLDEASTAAGISARAQALRAGLADDRRSANPPSGDDASSTMCSEQQRNGAQTPSFAAGAAYALEGSAMGAEVLRRRVYAADNDASTAYFDQLLAARKDRWATFCGWLESSQLSATDQREAARGAAAVFAYVMKCLDADGVSRMSDEKASQRASNDG